ncbi:MAG TPA: alkaline phosphatase D family protein [Micropepsaceae bacterium]|nr:alkaline phosphatase D family protein [Micropepsaceae bacterium]
MQQLYSRRLLLRRAALLAASGLTVAACGDGRPGRIKGANPFTLGVASGDPVPDGAVIWTRLLPFPQEPARTGASPIEIGWHVASDEGFTQMVQSGTVMAHPDEAFATRMEVRGLEPGRPYWYRFVTANEESPVGRFITAPPLGADLARLRMVLASCAHYEQGYFASYRHIAALNPDVVLHTGDYIYESSWGDPVRRHDGPEPESLDEYRSRYALYRSDADLQAAHANAAWLFTWDDHEVDNDYAAAQSEEGVDPERFVQRRAAAYRACFEHMPLRRSQMLRGLEMRLFQRNVFGNLVDLNILDNRQYRSDQACAVPGRLGGQPVAPDCPELLDPARSMLGEAQERQYLRNLRYSRGLWNVMANGVMFSRFFQTNREGAPVVWTDAWDGYMPARQRILSRVAELGLPNFITLAGDMHSSWVNELKADFDNPESSTLGTEFVCTSISSAGPDHELFSRFVAGNPHMKHFDARQRGFTMLTFTREQLLAEMMVLDDVRKRDASLSVLAAFAVQAGTPGATQI